ncbi:MAG: hypothetical protein ACYDBT_13250 [Desulfobulbaceae bacterium]
MRKVFLFCLATVLLVAVSAMAQNKVVVIPMGSGAKGTDGQVQYNDEGKTAGAEVYYDKATGKLELPGELRTVDETGNNRLWGKGRPGTGLMTHTDPDGYCTTSAGINLALSEGRDIWGNADDLCPAGTWVCSQNDMLDGSCPIQPFWGYLWFDCAGESFPATLTLYSYQYGWVSDEYNDEGPNIQGVVANSIGWTNLAKPTITKCYMIRAWCCWE